MTTKGPKRFLTHQKRTFAVGECVRVMMPGVNGAVVQVDDEKGALGQYWYRIKTKDGERREPGSNLELIPTLMTNSRVAGMILPGHTFHLHGANSRVNLNSADNSTNIVSTADDRVFVQLHEKVVSIENITAREDIQSRIRELEAASKSGGFLHAYQSFIASAADHMTLFAPLVPVLTQMLSTRF